MEETELVTVRLLFLIAQKLGVSKTELVNLVHQACRDVDADDRDEITYQLVSLLK